MDPMLLQEKLLLNFLQVLIEVLFNYIFFNNFMAIVSGEVIVIWTEFKINPKKVMHWVGMNLDLSGWIVNPRDLRISIVFRTLEKQSS